jgi:hypothetical protein
MNIFRLLGSFQTERHPRVRLITVAQVICHIWHPYSSSCTKYKHLGHVEVSVIEFFWPRPTFGVSAALHHFPKVLRAGSDFNFFSSRNLGISFKTQALYVAVFVTRYLDLFYRWVSFYNFVMKIFFIASSCYILYIMKYRFRSVFNWNATLSSHWQHSSTPHFLPPQPNAWSCNWHVPCRISRWTLLNFGPRLQLPFHPDRNPMVILHFPWIRRHSSATFYAPKNWRGRNYHHPLFGSVRRL